MRIVKFDRNVNGTRSWQNDFRMVKFERNSFIVTITFIKFIVFSPSTVALLNSIRMQFFYLSVIYSFIYPQRLYSTRSLLGRLSIRVDKRGSWASRDSRGLVFQIETVETRTGSLELAQFLPPLLGCNWLERISRTFKGYCFISTIASIHLPWFFFLSNYFRPAIFHVETSRKKKNRNDSNYKTIEE